jgi:hypothetical protein
MDSVGVIGLRDSGVENIGDMGVAGLENCGVEGGTIGVYTGLVVKVEPSAGLSMDDRRDDAREDSSVRSTCWGAGAYLPRLSRYMRFAGVVRLGQVCLAVQGC